MMVVQSLRLVVALSAQISTYELVVLKCHRSQRSLSLPTYRCGYARTKVTTKIKIVYIFLTACVITRSNTWRSRCQNQKGHLDLTKLSRKYTTIEKLVMRYLNPEKTLIAPSKSHVLIQLKSQRSGHTDNTAIRHMHYALRLLTYTSWTMTAVNKSSTTHRDDRPTRCSANALQQLYSLMADCTKHT